MLPGVTLADGRKGIAISGLSARADVGDLIEEERATVGQLEAHGEILPQCGGERGDGERPRKRASGQHGQAPLACLLALAGTEEGLEDVGRSLLHGPEPPPGTV